MVLNQNALAPRSKSLDDVAVQKGPQSLPKTALVHRDRVGLKDSVQQDLASLSTIKQALPNDHPLKLVLEELLNVVENIEIWEKVTMTD